MRFDAPSTILSQSEASSVATPARPPIVALGGSHPYQVGVVVPDLEAAMSAYGAPHGAGDVWKLWTYGENVLRERRYRGSSGTFSMRIALAAAGPDHLPRVSRGARVRRPSPGNPGSRHHHGDHRDGAGRLRAAAGRVRIRSGPVGWLRALRHRTCVGLRRGSGRAATRAEGSGGHVSVSEDLSVGVVSAIVLGVSSLSSSRMRPADARRRTSRRLSHLPSWRSDPWAIRMIK